MQKVVPMTLGKMHMGAAAGVALLVMSCSGGAGDVVASGPGPGSDEVPFVVVPGDGNPFSGVCEALVTCESLNATCGVVTDNCGNQLDCDNNEQDGNETDIDCGGGGACQTLCSAGRMCLAPGDCETALCFDGVCCSEDCSAVCMTCENGSCQPVQSNEEDPDTCTAPRACDGTGQCLLVTGQPCTLDEECVSGFCDTLGGTCF
jgi:hypothetical protein